MDEYVYVYIYTQIQTLMYEHVTYMYNINMLV